MREHDHMLKLCELVKDYKKSTGINCTCRMHGDVDDCKECDECRSDILCIFCSTSPEYAEICEAQNIYADSMAIDLCQPYVYLCPLGMTKWAVPIINGEKHIGTLIAGCARISGRIDIEDSKPPHFDYFQLPRKTFTKAWNDVPYRSPQQVHYVAQQLFYSVCYAMATDSSILLHHQKIWTERSILYEEIARQKSEQARSISTQNIGSGQDDIKVRSIEETLGLTKQDEKELVGRIQMGDKPAVKSILNKALGKIFLDDSGDINMTKALLIELLISVGRAAIQRKASGDELFELYQESIGELGQLENLNQVYSWTVIKFNKLSTLIYINRDEHKYSAVEQVARYIKKNYSKELSIDSIADAIGYSSYYISRIFKEELNMTIIDYLTEVRISRAKELLESTDDLIAVIAEEVGYQYSHYFARTFKKRVGISPSEYRRWWSRK